MMEPGVHESFDLAEMRLMDCIARADYYAHMLAAAEDYYAHMLAAAEDFYLIDRSMPSFYRMMLDCSTANARDIVEWAYDRGYITRSEHFNICHWLYWFDDPARITQPDYMFFEDFRYD